MREVAFSIPVSGVIRIDGNSITIIVNRAETNISLPPDEERGKRLSLEAGKTIYDIILDIHNSRETALWPVLSLQHLTTRPINIINRTGTISAVLVPASTG